MKMMKRNSLKRSALLVAVGSALVTLSSCGALRDDNGRPLNGLNPKGEGARIIDNLMNPVFLVAGIIFVLVEVGILVMLVKFRKRSDDQADPAQVHGLNTLEWGWTIAPAILLAILAIFNVQAIWDLQKIDADHITVEVIGQQWWWEYRYDTNNDGTPDIITANQLVIQAKQQVELRIRSNDVIHSFWIPQLNGKKDAVPGRVHDWTLKADAPGTFAGTCTEFCGLSHAYMRMEVKALSPEDFSAWIASQKKVPQKPAAGTLAAKGRDEFVSQCAQCHQINGYDPDAAVKDTDGTPNPDYRGKNHPLTSDNAPNLTHLMSRTKFAGNLFDLYVGEGENAQPNTSQIGDWLREPDKLKPMAADQNRGMPNLKLTEDQIEALVAYLVTLK